MTAKVLWLAKDVDIGAVDTRRVAIDTVEAGGVVALLERGFVLTPRERELISNTPELLVRVPKKRNGRPTILFDRLRGKMIGGISVVDGRVAFGEIRRAARGEVEEMMARFGRWADDLVSRLFPSYRPALCADRVTYRPNERSAAQPLHIDSSYGHPTQGRGMLRLFCNIDPAERPRVWQVGEPFESFVARYLPAVPAPAASRAAAALTRLGIRGSRSEYDRLIAELRRLGKEDESYQASTPREIVEFPSGSCWFGITDLVVHGAVSGQHSLDQTYYLPAAAMSDPSRSSLRILERLCRSALE